jgi:CRISPR-associated protein Csx14
MSTVYLATLGQRPEAITVALDKLMRSYSYNAVAILHTNPQDRSLNEAYQAIQRVMRADYPQLATRYHEITLRDGRPMNDVNTQDSADAYFLGVLDVLKHYREQGYHLHLMISGGRKAMSAYAMIAASYVFRSDNDRVLTVLSGESVMQQQGVFHVLPHQADQVRIVDLPLRYARVAPGADVNELLARPRSIKASFLSKLSPAEREVCEAMQAHPHATNAELGGVLGKSGDTVAKQLEKIYNKMEQFFETPIAQDKRSVLKELLRER